MSPNNSSRYKLYIRSNYSDYNIFKISNIQIQNIIQFYIKFEREMIVATSEAMATIVKL